MERSSLSIGLNAEPAAPVSLPPALQGESSPEDGKGKPSRPPLAAEAAAEAEPQDRDQNEDQDEDRAQHRIDSLA